eukprot:scaffold2331_cov378-Pavlova_lutheri.AAC.1
MERQNRTASSRSRVCSTILWPMSMTFSYDELNARSRESVTPGKPDSFEAMLFFVPLAVRHKTPTADQFIGHPPGLISRLVDELCWKYPFWTR